MSPAEREEVTKMLLPPSVSINTGDRRSSDESNDEGRAATQVRNKYLKRIGVGDGGNGSGSDNEPLLQ